MKKFILKLFLATTLLLSAGCSSVDNIVGIVETNNPIISNQISSYDISNFDISTIPEFDGSTPYVVLNNNIPDFSEEEKTSTEVYEIYPDFDSLGRCQSVSANLHVSNMPTEDRESIGMIKPSGWQTVKYDFVDGKYLYNRCHLIGFQLAGENANEYNLITGTRYMNVDGMLPFENMVADYLKETNNHVLFRVTPVFIDDELVARGVIMEAYSVEDQGEGIQFNVFVYNNQPGVVIDYATGESYAATEDNNQTTQENNQYKEADIIKTYILNINSKKVHLDGCPNADKISDKNKEIVEDTLLNIFAEGYEPAQCCIK